MMDFDDDPPVKGSHRQNIRYRHDDVDQYPYMTRTK
jgi:hypothetical protein